MKRQTFIEYSKVIIVALVITFFASLFGIVQFCFESDNSASPVSLGAVENKLTIVIDAGHGGEDGGAVGKKGTLEKDLNLAISKYLYDMFSITDVDVVLTRDKDSMLYEEGQENRKKFNDLNNRVKICNSFENPLFISIHQNKFPLEKYKGLQVYYSKNEGDGKIIADLVQSKTKMYLQQDNNRATKQAGRNIFVLDRARCPAILVECGFLSNAEDEKNLCDSEYQRKVAFIIFSSVMDYISNNDVKFQN